MSLSPIRKPRLLLPPYTNSPSPSLSLSLSPSPSPSAAAATSQNSWNLPTTSISSLESRPPPITSHTSATSPVPDIARSASVSASASASTSVSVSVSVSASASASATTSLTNPRIGGGYPSCHSPSVSDPDQGPGPGPGPDAEDRPRTVFIHDPDRTQSLNEEFNGQSYSGGGSGNKVRTSKYTLLSFLPRNLFEQFRRLAYLYFLTILCLNQIPQLAVFTRYASAVPLGFVLLLTAVKDGYEDWRRHRSDEKENNRLAMVLTRDGEYNPKRWKHIRVGEVVKVHAHETIPCDLLLLKTSDPSGLAYVQTINLDGESNLKTRYARLELASQFEMSSQLEKSFSQSSHHNQSHHHHHHHRHHHHPIISGKVICEKPNRNIYGFTAYAEIDGKQQIPLGPTNLILRGCELKNTSWAIGVVIYAGQETKVMLNSAGAQSKRSRLESNMNRETLWLSVFLLICCLVSGLGMGLWLNTHKDELLDLPYYGKTSENYYGYYGTIGEALFAFLSSLISFQIMIPISLYISMELVRLGQSYFMIHDVEMYHSETDTRFQCRDLSINEDLGQIKYLFSDKTGTLTENKMEFRNASIFGGDYTHVGSGNKLADVMNEISNVGEILRGIASDGGMGRAVILDYFLTLAACNTVVPTKVETITSNVGTLELEITELGSTDCYTWEYQSESPDEQALVLAAASYGFRLLSRTSNHLVIDIRGESQKFEVLGMHEFDSNRKCMSVVLKCPDGSTKVFVKGADSTVLNKIKLAKGNTEIEEEQQSNVLLKTQIHLAQYSEQGLRTLVVAARELSITDLNHWKRLYGKANASLKDRQHLLNEAAQVIEKDLTLLGATGIEDKLQKGVPDAIATLREAGIKIWVLTGDKQETAISIGHSCALLTNDMRKIIINESEKDRCLAALRNARATYVLPYENRAKYEILSGSVEFTSSEKWKRQSDSVPVYSESRSSQDKEMEGSQGMCRLLALIIDGNSLVHALEPDLEQELYDLATACRVVICCRVAPLQKAGIVSLVKRKSGEMTLAIGDGANDVSMIQMADVGVGISGQEGRQAVLASDFALGQFRFLKRLLLVHGRLNYQRLGSMVLYNFYRNAVFIMLLFWYMLYAAFSTSPAITQWSLVLYSIIYTSVPTIIVAILDRDLDPITLLRYPPLYKGGQNDESYNKMLFWLTMLDTLWQSMILFYVPYLTYKGGDIDIWSIGSVWTISVVVLVNVHLGMDVQHFTWITHLALWGSIAATYVCIIVLDVINDDNQDHYWVIFHVASKASYWLNIVLIVILALLPRFIIKMVRQMFKPSDAQIVRENEILLNTDRGSISSLKKT